MYLSYFSTKTYVVGSLEAPQRGASNEYHKICFCGEIRNMSSLFVWKIALSGTRTQITASVFIFRPPAYSLARTAEIYNDLIL